MSITNTYWSDVIGEDYTLSLSTVIDAYNEYATYGDYEDRDYE